MSIPFDEFAKRIGSGNDESGETEAESLRKELKEKLGILPEITINGSIRISDAAKPFARALDVRELSEEYLSRKMLSSKDSKHVAFVHVHSKEILQIDVPPGGSAELNLLFLNMEPLVTQVLINVGKGAKLNLSEWYGSKSTKRSLVSVIHEATLHEYSNVEMNMVHNTDSRTYAAFTSRVVIGDNAKLEFNSIYDGGALTKVKNDIIAEGYAAKSRITEMVIGSSTQGFDINTVVVNANRDTVSELESKGAMADGSRCLLKGFADIRENAPGSMSFVHERGILLGKEAHMDSIPGMSIKNSDVKATHSSAVAPVDEDSLFYLMSRGASMAEARMLLVSGFFSGSFAKITNPALKEAVASLMREKIYTGAFGSVPKATMSGIWTDADPDSSIFKGHYKYKDE